MPMAAKRSGANICRKWQLPNCSAASVITEPDHGSDPGSMATRAEKVAGGFRLTGTKIRVDHQCADRGPWRDLEAKLDGKIRGGFIVERGTKGFSTPKIEGKLSLRASITERKSCSKAPLFPEEEPAAECHRPCRPRSGCLNVARAGIAWGAMGAAEFCWHRARDYVLTRKQFNRPLAAQPAGSEKARRYADRDHARPSCRTAAVAADRSGQGIAAGNLAAQAQQLRPKRSISRASPAICTAATVSPRNSTSCA